MIYVYDDTFFAFLRGRILGNTEILLTLNYWWKFICVNEYVSVKKITLIFCFSFEHIKTGKKGFWGACFMPKQVCLNDLYM